MFSEIKSLILDLDMTLVIPKHKDFYSKYGEMVEASISAHYEVSSDKALEIAQYYRKQYGGAEYALYHADVHNYFDDVLEKPHDYALIYDNLNKIVTSDQFENRSHISQILQQLRKLGMTIILLTSSPDNLAKSAIAESGFDINKDFDHVYYYEREKGPLKILSASAFQNIISQHDLDPASTLSIGDSKIYDIIPAINAGIKACLISPDEPDGDEGYVIAKDINIILQTLLNNLEAKQAV